MAVGHKNRYPSWEHPGQWSQRLKPAVVGWTNFDPYPPRPKRNSPGAVVGPGRAAPGRVRGVAQGAAGALRRKRGPMPGGALGESFLDPQRTPIGFSAFDPGAEKRVLCRSRLFLAPGVLKASPISFLPTGRWWSGLVEMPRGFPESKPPIQATNEG